MKITDEAVEAALDAMHGEFAVTSPPIFRKAVRSVLEAALPHLIDDGAAASTAASSPVAEATSPPAPSSPHLREALEALAADWRSLPHDPNSVATSVLRHCGAQITSALTDNPIEGATPAIDREALKYLLSYHYYDAKWSKEHQGFRCVCGWLGEDHVQHVVDLIGAPNSGASEDDR